MSKKIILIILGVVLVLGGGFALYYFFLRPTSPQALTNTYIKTADDFVANLVRGNGDGAYNMLSQDQRVNYNETYWKQEFFPQFSDYKELPQRVKGQAVAAVDPLVPPPYPPGYDPWEFTYTFRLNGLTYQLDFMIIKQDDQLKIDAVRGNYQELTQ